MTALAIPKVAAVELEEESEVHYSPAPIAGGFIGASVYFAIAGASAYLAADGAFDAAGSLWAVAAVSGVAGALLLVLGFRALAAHRERQRRRRDHANDPARADYRWEGDVQRYSTAPTVVLNLVRIAYLTPMIAPGVALLYFADSGLLNALAFLAAGVYSIGFVYTGYLAARWLQHGTSELRFDGAPFSPGGLARFRFVAGRALELQEPLRVTLRFVEERHEYRGSGRRREQVVVLYRRYRETQEIEPKNGRLEAGEQLPLAFDLPDDPTLVNRLSRRPASYWQLVVEGAVAGADHRSLFFVPVYWT